MTLTGKLLACVLAFLVVTPVGVGTAKASHQRAITDFDAGWRFHYGDASGADGVSYPDSSWRTVSVPHDWAVEGPNPPADPFSQSAASTGRGGYASSGIGW